MRFSKSIIPGLWSSILNWFVAAAKNNVAAAPDDVADFDVAVAFVAASAVGGGIDVTFRVWRDVAFDDEVKEFKELFKRFSIVSVEDDNDDDVDADDKEFDEGKEAAVPFDVNGSSTNELLRLSSLLLFLLCVMGASVEEFMAMVSFRWGNVTAAAICFLSFSPKYLKVSFNCWRISDVAGTDMDSIWPSIMAPFKGATNCSTTDATFCVDADEEEAFEATAVDEPDVWLPSAEEDDDDADDNEEDDDIADIAFVWLLLGFCGNVKLLIPISMIILLLLLLLLLWLFVAAPPPGPAACGVCALPPLCGCCWAGINLCKFFGWFAVI